MVTNPSSFTLPPIGTLWEGGYFAGCIKVDANVYAVILAPKESGQASTLLRWKTSNDNTPNTGSVNDGWTNTNNMNNSQHPAAQYCRSLSIGGKNDWYLPSRDENDVILRAFYWGTTPFQDYTSRGHGNYSLYDRRDTYFAESFKYPPTYGLDANGAGYNPNYVDPVTKVVGKPAYRGNSPSQTTVAVFKPGGSQVLGNCTGFETSAGSGDNFAMNSSTQRCSITAWSNFIYPVFPWGPTEFFSNYNLDAPKTRAVVVRAVRRILIS